MRITIIPSDKAIGIDGHFYLNMKEDLSWIPSDVHAVQWYDTWGEIEYIDADFNVRNEKIEELGIYEQAIQCYADAGKREEDEERQRLEEVENSTDYWKILRDIRDYLLLQSDWTQSVTDSPLTEEQINAWKEYRQQLRELPDKIEDPKPLVLDQNHPSWPVKPS